jgi:TonB dependent receptor/CarboxypepD_reg-like domain/TonB-dependent Receptor Plug Domain
MHRKIFYFLLILALCPMLLTAGTRGRIKGKVVDLQTGDALIGANVVVVGSTSGANTDANGEFLIQNMEAGVYTLKISYVGYKTITLANVRVNADLTAYVAIQLPNQDIQVSTVDIVAQKPMIQKDATNAVRLTTNDDIQALPVRGVTNIVALTAGVVLQNNNVYIRGGRFDEVGYYLEGISIKNPVSGGRQVTLSQDAIEEIQVQAGGYTAEFGNANSGIIRSQLRTGTPDLKASYEYITDNIGLQGKDNAYSGDKRLGAYWWGYNEQSAVLSGPLFDNRFKFFSNFNYVYERDNSYQPWPGVNIGYIGDATSLDTINLVYPGGPRPGAQSQTYTYTGTLNMDFKPILLRVSGVYSAQNDDVTGNIGNFLQNYLNTRRGREERSNGTFSLKMTHVLSNSMYYELTAGYYFSKYERFTPGLGSNYWSYGDSVANAAVGWPTPRGMNDAQRNRVGQYVQPSSISIDGFDFARNGTVPTTYGKSSQASLSLSGALNFMLGKTHTFKLGGDYQQYTIRSWGANSQTDLAGRLNTFETTHPGYSAADLNAFEQSTLLNVGVSNYGYDYLGNEINGTGLDAPHRPVFADAYIQDRIEYEDLIINAGLRYDYIDIDNKMFLNPTMPDLSFDKSGNLIPSGWVNVPTFSSVSPRIGLSFPVTDKTMFHAQFGKFVQQPDLNSSYIGYAYEAWSIKGGFFITTPVGLNVRPTRTTQYELGFTQQLTDFMSFDISGYYKDIAGQDQVGLQTTDRNSAYQAYSILFNSDFATTKGIELSLNMRRFQRISANASISFQDARGTASSQYGNLGIVGAPLDGVTIYTPKYISPLDQDQAVRGTFNVDYRFGPNDGPSILHNFGVSVLATFNSGHPYTLGTGGPTAQTDSRNRTPLEPLNSSTTPSEFQLDLRVDKTVAIWDKLNLNIYIYVINLFDNLNVNNVYLLTGVADDNGYLSNPEFSAKTIATYGPQYAQLYKSLVTDYQSGGITNVYAPPRQIRVGFRLEY